MNAPPPGSRFPTQPPARRSQDITLNGITARVCRAGAETARWLVLVHGLGESGHCFRRLLSHRELGAWNLLVPDLPGYGRSSHLTTPSTLPDFAERLIEWLPAVLEQLEGPGEHEIVFLGHSMGGVIGQILCELTETRPDALGPVRMRGFVNVEGNLSLGDCGHSAVAAPWKAGAYADRGHSDLVQMIWRDGIERPADRSYFVSASLADPLAYHLNSRELVELSRAEDLALRFAELSLPRTFLYGAPHGTAPRSLELLAAAQITPQACSPAGHWPFIDQLDQFASRLSSFLDCV